MTLKEVLKLKKSVSKVMSLAQPAQKVIYNYSHLNLGNKLVSVPYYINRHDPVPTNPGEYYKPRRALTRALAAKGSPTELEAVVKRHALKYGFSLEKESVERIQDFMFAHGLGIDCSGFVVWVLNEIAKLKFNKKLWECITIQSLNPLKRLIVKFRPLENISVTTLRNNSQKIDNLKDVRAGDILITHPKSTYDHILLITEIGFIGDKPIYIDYVQATAWYSNRYGIINGTIIIKFPDSYLIEQEWFEDNVRQNFTYAGIRDDPKAAKIMRLNCL